MRKVDVGIGFCSTTNGSSPSPDSPACDRVSKGGHKRPSEVLISTVEVKHEKRINRKRGENSILKSDLLFCLLLMMNK